MNPRAVHTRLPATVSDVRLERDPRGRVWSVTADVVLGADVKVRVRFTVAQALAANIVDADDVDV